MKGCLCSMSGNLTCKHSSKNVRLGSTVDYLNDLLYEYMIQIMIYLSVSDKHWGSKSGNPLYLQQDGPIVVSPARPAFPVRSYEGNRLFFRGGSMARDVCDTIRSTLLLPAPYPILTIGRNFQEYSPHRTDCRSPIS